MENLEQSLEQKGARNHQLRDCPTNSAAQDGKQRR